MDTLIYNLFILLSSLSYICIPVGLGIAFYGYSALGNSTVMIAGAALTVISALLIAPMRKMRRKYREISQTDENGRLKGTTFNELSKSERTAIAKQRTAMLENIVSTTELNKKTKRGSTDPQGDMNRLVGLDSVKQEMREMVARMEFDKKDKNLHDSSMSGRHMVFYGSPGTGKAQPLYSKVLTPNGFKKMGDIHIGDTVISGRGTLATVIGVYPQGIKPIYEVTLSDGSKCRCSDEHLWNVISKSGKTETLELHTIIDNIERGEKYSIASPSNLDLSPITYHNDDLFELGKEFGHTGEAIPDKYMLGSYRDRHKIISGLFCSEMGDDGYLHPSEESADSVVALIRSVGGWAEKKNGGVAVKFGIPVKYIEDIKYIDREECQCIYIDDPSHLYVTDDYIVTHNTTVARIITGFLYQNGYIAKNQLIEIDGNFLKAGEYTAIKTEEVIKRAKGGVLFIDEAYALMQSTDGSGQEAIATLIKQMEDSRSDFILIMAGYTDEMQDLLRMNPGFSSRIKEYLDFPDYDDKSMREIFALMAKDDGFTVDPKAYKAFDARVAKERRTASFGNGRTARNILDEARNKHALNFIEKHLPESQRYVIGYDDIPQNLKRSSNF